MISQVSSVLPKINRVAISEHLAVLFCPAPNKKTFAVTIDRSDLGRVQAAGFWYVGNLNSRSFALYCYRNKKGGGVELLHRFLLQAQPGTLVDHAHHRTLDNRRSEIRPADRFQNCQNSRTRKDSTTGFRGITPGRNGTYRARIRVNGCRVSLGHFPTQQAAAKAYDEAAKKYHGAFAFTNEINFTSLAPGVSVLAGQAIRGQEGLV